jgi:hypothetical protein
VNGMLEELDYNSGKYLLEKMPIMADRLLDHKFWFEETRKYRRLELILFFPKH